jgi:hypothetical protein
MIQQLTHRVRVSLEAPKFYYEIGHYDPQGVFYEHVVSGFLFDSYGDAEREAVKVEQRVQKALALRLRRQGYAQGWQYVDTGNGAA